jgi:hypothetical protein
MAVVGAENRSAPPDVVACEIDRDEAESVTSGERALDRVTERFPGLETEQGLRSPSPVEVLLPDCPSLVRSEQPCHRRRGE